MLGYSILTLVSGSSLRLERFDPYHYTFILYFSFISSTSQKKNRAKSQNAFGIHIILESRVMGYTFKFKICEISFLSFYLLYTPIIK